MREHVDVHSSDVGLSGDTHWTGDDLQHHGKSVVVCGHGHLEGEDNNPTVLGTEQLQHHLTLAIRQASLFKNSSPLTIITSRTASLAVTAGLNVFMVTSPGTVMMVTMPTWFLIERRALWEESDWFLLHQNLEQVARGVHGLLQQSGEDASSHGHYQIGEQHGAVSTGARGS